MGVQYQVTGEQTAKWRKEVGGQRAISTGAASQIVADSSIIRRQDQARTIFWLGFQNNSFKEINKSLLQNIQ